MPSRRVYRTGQDRYRQLNVQTAILDHLRAERPQARTLAGVHFVPVVLEGQATAKAEPDLPWREALTGLTPDRPRTESWVSYPAR